MIYKVVTVPKLVLGKNNELLVYTNKGIIGVIKYKPKTKSNDSKVEKL